MDNLSVIEETTTNFGNGAGLGGIIVGLTIGTIMATGAALGFTKWLTKSKDPDELSKNADTVCKVMQSSANVMGTIATTAVGIAGNSSNNANELASVILTPTH